MKGRSTPLPTRREFVHQLGCGLAACAVGGLAPRMFAAGRRSETGDAAEPRALILIQLEGGHDGASTFVPLADDGYYRLRPTLALARHDLIRLDGSAGLARAGRGLEPLFKDGKLAVVPGVGCANPSPSHFRSTEIWHTASDSDERLYSGWLGRTFAELEAQSPPVAAYHGGRAMPRVFVRDEDRLHSGAAVRGEMRQPLAHAGADAAVQLAEIGERAGGVAGAEVYFVSIPGFDTHFDQGAQHAARLGFAADALLALQRRLERRGVDHRVLTVVFSEFGRSAAENAQGGTDHGEAGPVLLLGARVRGGFHGRVGGEPLDFRRVLATVTERWLRTSTTAVLGRAFEPLALFS
ncbi:MAG: hypothetical protein JWM88_2455 [Verrucomicrobia bacterium]|nr:hypothetical protein [Verrucomicrobiota bacterium]